MLWFCLSCSSHSASLRPHDLTDSTPSPPSRDMTSKNSVTFLENFHSPSHTAISCLLLHCRLTSRIFCSELCTFLTNFFSNPRKITSSNTLASRPLRFPTFSSQCFKCQSLISLHCFFEKNGRAGDREKKNKIKNKNKNSSIPNLRYQQGTTMLITRQDSLTHYCTTQHST